MAHTTPISDFDAELAAFLDWRSDQVAGAPPATEVTHRIAQRTGVGARPRATFAHASWLFVALALSLALIAAAAWFASRPPALVTTIISPNPSASSLASPSTRVQPPLLAGTVAVALGVGNLDAIDPQTNRMTGLVLCDTPCNGLSSPTWSPDGTRLAYLVPVMSSDGFAAPKRGIWIKDMLTGSSGQLVPCTQPADCALDRPLAWSPDGQWIAFFQGSALVIAPVDGGPIRSVIDVGTLDPTISSLSVSWSPDSQRLNFTTQSGQWESVNIDGTDHQVHPAPLFVWLTVSPDETQIAYVTLGGLPQPSDPALAIDPGSAALFVASPDGSNAQEVAVLPNCCMTAWLGAPAWSADGSQLAWAGYDGSPGVHHIVLLIAGGQQRSWQLATVAESRPAWAPGATPISPRHLIPTPEPLPTLVPRSSVGASNCTAMDAIADTLGATDDPLAPRSPAPPAQPSNGSIVAGLLGSGGIDGYIGLFAPTFDQDTQPRKLLYTASNDGRSAMSDFAWSGDGSAFAFVVSDAIDPDRSTSSVVGFSCGTLFAAASDGTSPRRLVPPAQGYGVMAPAWSPDGTRIAYLSYQAPVGQALVQPPVFRAVRVLDLRDRSDRAIGPCSGCTALEWSPDGAWVAGLVPTERAVQLVSTLTGDSTRLPQDAGSVRWVDHDLLLASVSADGSSLSVTRVHPNAQPVQVDAPRTILAPHGSTFTQGPIAFDARGARLALAVKNSSFDATAQVQLGTVDIETGHFTPADDEHYAEQPSNVLWSPDGTEVLFESPIGVIERDRVDGTDSATNGPADVIPGLNGEAWQPVWP